MSNSSRETVENVETVETVASDSIESRSSIDDLAEETVDEIDGAACGGGGGGRGGSPVELAESDAMIFDVAIGSDSLSRLVTGMLIPTSGWRHIKSFNELLLDPEKYQTSRRGH